MTCPSCWLLDSQLREARAYCNLLRAMLVSQQDDMLTPRQLRYVKELVKADFKSKFYRPKPYWAVAKDTADKLGVKV